MTTTPNDAVEALENAILSATDGYTRDKAKYVAQHLLESGYTITRASQMTEAELERRATMLVVGIRTGKYNVGEVVELAKKYRGTL